MKRKAIKPARAMAADILWASDSEECVIPRLMLMTLLDDIVRLQDEANHAKTQYEIICLWRDGWQKYLDAIKKEQPTCPSGRSPLASDP